jgi:hypothetical protein
MTVDAYGTETNPAPGEVAIADLWNLHASPATLEEVAGEWRVLQLGSVSAQGTVDAAAHEVLAGGGWQGDAADAYDEHRAKLTADLGELGAWAGSVADALDALAWVLRSAQEQLDQQWAALTAAVPATREGETVVFRPADHAQTTAVSTAISTARDIRAWVDEELVIKEAAFGSTDADLTTIGDTWEDRTVRLVNLNVGSGNDNNNLGDYPGVGPEEVDDLADQLDDEDADIVTLQEVFEDDLDDLEEQLEERTGDEWNVHFGEASEKARFTDPLSWLDPDHASDPFGNAVLVREGESIEGSERVGERIKLDEPGSDVETPDGTIGDGEGRSGVQVEITYRDQE